jgi:hypothetical protein
VSSLPWYQQLTLDFYVKSILTDAQNRQFVLEPVVGDPKLLVRSWTEPHRFVSGRTVECSVGRTGVERPHAATPRRSPPAQRQ